jgi:hypothetical protein
VIGARKLGSGPTMHRCNASVTPTPSLTLIVICTGLSTTGATTLAAVCP